VVCVDGGAGVFEGYGVVADEGEILEAEVVHGAGHGTDVVWVAGADKDDAGVLAGTIRSRMDW
jgi:hypothetical protein